MAGPTKAQLAGELTTRLLELERALGEYRAVTDFRLKQLEEQLADRTRTEEQLQARLTDLTAKNATLEERCRHLEKQSDRGWSFGQAVVVSVISMIGGALLSLLFKK